MVTLSDQTYKELLEHSFDLVNIMREDGVILYESPSVREMLGYETGELVGTNILSLIHPLDLPHVIAIMAEGKLNRGKRYEIILRFKHKDGSWRWLESVGKYLPENNEIQGIFIRSRDITAQHELEEEKMSKTIRYQSILSSMIEGVTILDSNGVIVDCNESACRILGLTRDQIIGKTPMDPHWTSTHEDGSPFLGQDHPTMTVLRSKEAKQGVVMSVNKLDGTKAWVEVNASPLTDKKGEFLGVVASFTDITKRKIDEEELSQFEHIIEQSPATIVVTDLNGRIEYVNPAFTKTTGYTKEELIGQNPRLLKSGTTSPETYKELWDTITGKKVWHGELCNKKKSGELYWEFATISPILDKSGTIVKYSAIKENITDRKEIEKRKSQSEEYLGNIINVAGDPIFVKDRKHRWVLLNDSMCSFVGRTREELIGHSDYDFFQKEEADIFWAKDEEVFELGKENSNEESFTDAKGQLHTILTKKTLYTDKNGEQFIVGVIRDITKQKLIDEELKKRAEELERMNALMVGRELKMAELKEELRKLGKQT